MGNLSIPNVATNILKFKFVNILIDINLIYFLCVFRSKRRRRCKSCKTVELRIGPSMLTLKLMRQPLSSAQCVVFPRFSPRFPRFSYVLEHVCVEKQLKHAHSHKETDEEVAE